MLNNWPDKSNISLKKTILKAGTTNGLEVNETATCFVDITNETTENSTESTYLSKEIGQESKTILLGRAIDPIDWCIETFILTMVKNETCRCTVQAGTLKFAFVITLKDVKPGKYYFEHTLSEMYELAQLYKENGVKCFKSNPWLAHEYFNKAAKCLLTFLPYSDFESQSNDLNIPPKDVQMLFETISGNLSACFLKENRHSDVIEVLSFVNDQLEPTEKHVYRLATSYINTKQFEKAKLLLEKNDYKKIKSLAQLYSQLQECWKSENDKYASMVRKMFV